MSSKELMIIKKKSLFPWRPLPTVKVSGPFTLEAKVQGHFHRTMPWGQGGQSQPYVFKKKSIEKVQRIQDFGGSVVKNPPANAEGTGSIPGLGRSSGEGNGNPLQYSYLENSRDRGAWQATVHGVAKSRIQLSDWTTTTYYRKEKKNHPQSHHSIISRFLYLKNVAIILMQVL